MGCGDMKTLLFRGLDQQEKTKLINACHQVIDLLRKDLKLRIWECYLVSKVLLEEFPVEDLPKERGDG